MPGTAPELPFFVYGTLLPGEPNHDLFLRGRAVAEQPALLPGALLYEGPGYPYAIEGHGTVHGVLVTAAPGAGAELLARLDRLERYLGAGHPDNLYERVVREVRLQAGRRTGTGAGTGTGTSRAWVYLAAASVTRSLRTRGTPVPGGNWLTRRPPSGR
ncbi:gamma-glutamylcyclotransferase family protein [Streptomyces sp. NPDC058231]|uniref:gamma-glutamylcyclotransferase family protein n=1 Tax=Streptomyces sp. NPDC058231 TaxID=3346392 RepID=UPI0036ECF606